MEIKIVRHSWFLRILALIFGRWYFDEQEGFKLCFVIFKGTVYLVYAEKV